MAEQKKIVVVGGGIAGASVAKSLEDYGHVTLIDPKDYFEVTYAALRSVVEPKFAHRSIIEHKHYLKKAELVIDAAVNVTETDVITGSGKQIPYDYLVLASGSRHHGVSTRTGRLEEFEAEHEKVKNASTILIIGGGPVGVELAAEIAVDFPDKKIILVHSGERLIEFLGPKASKKALAWLESKKVEAVLNEKIPLADLQKGSYTTEKGRVIAADEHFVCIGKTVGSAWLKESHLKGLLDEKQRVKVNKYLQVEGKTNIFAAGDITDLQEPKQGYLASKHAEVVAGNIKKLVKKGDGAKLGSYKAMTSSIGIVSLGRYVGVAQFPFGTFLGKFPAKLKKDLFVGQTRKNLGLKEYD